MTNRINFTTRVGSAAYRVRELTPVRRQPIAVWRRSPDTGRLQMQWSMHPRRESSARSAAREPVLAAAPPEPLSRLAA